MVARIVCVIVAALAPLSSAFMLQQPGFAPQGVRAPACVMKAAALRTNDMVQVISGADKVRGAPFVWLHSAFIKPFAASCRDCVDDASTPGHFSHSAAFYRFRCAQGKVGKLTKINIKKGEVVVEGINVRTKHVKPMKEGESGSLVKSERPIHISNVKLSDEQPAPAAEEAAPAE